MRADEHLFIDSTALFADRLGAHGIHRDEVLALSPRLADLRTRIRAWRAGTLASFFLLPFATDTETVVQRGRRLAQQFTRTRVLGLGGSSLGGEMLVRLLGQGTHPVRFYDNIDPTTLTDLDGTDWHDTFLLVISKSGDTAETLSQLLTVLPQMECALRPAPRREQILVITENPAGALHQLAQELKLEILPHPAVGGRYSVLSVVGLLPAAIAGADITALLRGARAMAERCADESMELNPAFFQGAAQFLHAQRGRSVCVQMTYADRLRAVTHWYRQLWGESLGKRDAQGQAQGLTPVEAIGVTDQHSQLQLYLDGPDDKQFTFLVDPALRTQGTRIPDRFRAIPAIAPLVGHTTGELFLAEFDATRETITRHGRPNRTISLAPDNAVAIGELIMLLEMETVVVAELLGVNPFDQPAVEEGKTLAREYLKKY
jgi:glucose-6-phosphate isomerase